MRQQQFSDMMRGDVSRGPRQKCILAQQAQGALQPLCALTSVHSVHIQPCALFYTAGTPWARGFSDILNQGLHRRCRTTTPKYPSSWPTACQVTLHHHVLRQGFDEHIYNLYQIH